tara:strand:+ start:1223 stop:1426 length:204 start_codon:yes stop_codon:yes gene_type:complete
MAKADQLIDKIESQLDTIEKLVDEISLLCMDSRQRIDKYKEKETDEDIEDFPELDEFNNLDEDEEKE